MGNLLFILYKARRNTDTFPFSFFFLILKKGKLQAEWVVTLCPLNTWVFTFDKMSILLYSPKKKWVYYCYPKQMWVYIHQKNKCGYIIGKSYLTSFWITFLFRNYKIIIINLICLFLFSLLSITLHKNWNPCLQNICIFFGWIGSHFFKYFM